jgi:hypothetical protein
MKTCFHKKAVSKQLDAVRDVGGIHRAGLIDGSDDAGEAAMTVGHIAPEAP